MFLPLETNLPLESLPYKLEIFSKRDQVAISIVCQVLGYDYDLIVDEIVMAMLLIIILCCQKLSIMLDFVTFLVNIMHDQLKNFALVRFLGINPIFCT